MKKADFVLDACALIAYLRKEEGHQKVIELFDKATDLEAKVFMHLASFSEVYYDFWRVSDETVAEKVASDLLFLPIELIENISMQMTRKIGYFKTSYKISFADSFVLATAKLHNARVVTCDHHEFDPIEKNGDLEFEWIR